MMKFLKKFLIAALFMAGLGMAATYEAKAQAEGAAPAAAAMPSQEQMDSTLQTLKDMPADQRQQMLNAALQNFQNMPPEERQKLIDAAKSRVENLSDSQKEAYHAQWQSVLTPEQKKQMMDKLGHEAGEAATPASTTAPPAENKTQAIIDQIQDLTPEQKQKLMDKLKAGQ